MSSAGDADKGDLAGNEQERVDAPVPEDGPTTSIGGVDDPVSIDVTADKPAVDDPTEPSEGKSETLDGPLENHVPSSPAAAPADGAPLPDSSEDLRRSLLDLRKIHDAALLSQESTLDELAALQKGHAFISAAKAAVDVELREERRKREAAEETVEMLRGQLEASRRALGTLKHQNQQQQQQQPPQQDGHDSPKIDQGPLPRAAKRQSLLFSREADVTSESGSPKLSGSSTMPNSGSRIVSGGLRELRLGATPASPPPTQTSHLETPVADSNRRWSAFPSFTGSDSDRPPLTKRSSQASSSAGIDLGSPLREAASISAASGGGIDVSTNLSAYEEELAALKLDVASLRGQLAESQEARIASENCLRALREFVASKSSDDMHAEGGAIKLPPLPTDAELDEHHTPTLPVRPSGWRIGSFFKSPAAHSTTANKDASIASNVSDAGDASPSRGVGLGLPLDSHQSPAGTPLSNFVSNWTKSLPPMAEAQPTPPPLPTRRTGSYTFGGLFNKASSSSAAPSLTEVDEREQVATTGAEEMERDENAERRGGDEPAKATESAVEPVKE